MDIAKSFTFVGDDPKWVNKLLIGGGLFLAGALLSVTVIGGIVIFALIYGYLLHLTRNVIEGRLQPLPEWDNWGQLLRDGLKHALVYLIAALPLILLGLALLLPGIILSTSNDTDVAALGGVAQLGAYCVILPLSLLLAFLMPVAYARLAVTGSIREAVRPREILATLRANLTNYLIVFLLASFAASAVAYLGVIACVVGIFFTSFYALLVTYHLYGQAYRQVQGLQPGIGQPQPPYPPSPSYPY